MLKKNKNTILFFQFILLKKTIFLFKKKNIVQKRQDISIWVNKQNIDFFIFKYPLHHNTLIDIFSLKYKIDGRFFFNKIILFFIYNQSNYHFYWYNTKLFNSNGTKGLSFYTNSIWLLREFFEFLPQTNKHIILLRPLLLNYGQTFEFGIVGFNRLKILNLKTCWYTRELNLFKNKGPEL